MERKKTLRNIKNIGEKDVGCVKRIICAISERTYCHHTFKAALPMIQGLMLSGMLTNSETWINILESDITKLTMPDTMLQRLIQSTLQNLSNVFMSLELGVVPLRYVPIENV